MVVVIVVVVAGLTIGGAFWFGSLLFGHACPGCPQENTPIGAALEFGAVTGGVCPQNDTFADEGCQGLIHFAYRVHVAESTVTLGSFELSVQSALGAAVRAPGALGFSILGPAGTMLAEYSTVGGWMSMNSTWTFSAGITSATPLSTADVIVIDIGSQNPSGFGLVFVAQAAGDGYTGTTDPVILP